MKIAQATVIKSPDQKITTPMSSALPSVSTRYIEYKKFIKDQAIVIEKKPSVGFTLFILRVVI